MANRVYVLDGQREGCFKSTDVVVPRRETVIVTNFAGKFAGKFWG